MARATAWGGGAWEVAMAAAAWAVAMAVAAWAVASAAAHGRWLRRRLHELRRPWGRATANIVRRLRGYQTQGAPMQGQGLTASGNGAVGHWPTAPAASWPGDHPAANRPPTCRTSSIRSITRSWCRERRRTGRIFRICCGSWMWRRGRC